MSLANTLTLLSLMMVATACRPGTAQDPERPWLPQNEQSRVALDQRIEKFASDLDAVGASGVIAIALDGRTSAYGFGRVDDDRRRRVDHKTVFDIGSITKQFTAAAILRLEVDGRLNVTDDIGQHLPDVPIDKRTITIHQLLTHTAGLRPAVGDDYEPLQREAFLERALGLPLQSEPGTGYEYSNVGYSLLAAIIELRSGLTYEAYLKQALFDRAGMQRTGYQLPQWNSAEIAVGYRNATRWGAPNEKPWADDGPFWNLRGNGGLLSTAEDLLLWHEALLTDAVLPTEVREKLYQRHTAEGERSGTHYGYGWALFPTSRGTTLVTHNGGNGVFFADFLRFLEEKVVVVFLTNRATPAVERVGFEVARMIFDSAYVAAVRTAETRIEQPLVPDGPLGEFAHHVASVLTNGDRDALEALVRNDFDAEFAAIAPHDRHLEILTQMRQELEGTVIQSVAGEGDEIVVTLERDSGEQLALLIVHTSSAPYKIKGLAIQE